MSNQNDDKKDPELYDQITGREIAASGFPAPTTEEAIYELGIIKNLLETHGCATTRDLVSAASVAIDVAHKDAHSHTPEGLQTQIIQFAMETFGPLQATIFEKAATFQNLEEKAKFFARMTSILLQIARITGAHSLEIIRKAIKADVAIYADADTAINTDSSEEAIKKLLDIPMKNTYKN